MRHGLQTEIAKEARVSPSYIGHIINGRRRPGYDAAKRLERVTGISIRDWREAPAPELKAALSRIEP